MVERQLPKLQVAGSRPVYRSLSDLKSVICEPTGHYSPITLIPTNSMSDDVRMGGFEILPPVVKNLLIINVLFFLGTLVAEKFGVDLNAWLGLHYFSATDFHVWQPLTYMFMHADFGHLFFNMFALWMFGAAVENAWGGKRFLVFYLITGLGAGFTHFAVFALTIQPNLNLINAFLADPSFANFENLYNGLTILKEMPVQAQSAWQQTYLQLLQAPNDTASLNEVAHQVSLFRDNYLNANTVIGASGAVFGVLLAFGMLFPNSQIYIYFLLPVKAKWFVIFYGALELFYGVTGTQEGVAHFAHLGGMIFGIILILIWRKHDRHYTQDEWNY